ncbi:unnamed protein product [Caretta caretta]
MMVWGAGALCADNIEGAGNVKCVSSACCAEGTAHAGGDTQAALPGVSCSNGESCRRRHVSLADKKACGVKGAKTDKLSSISADVAKIDWIRWNCEEGPDKGEDTVLKDPKEHMHHL